MDFYHIQMHLPFGREDGTYLDPREMLKESSPIIGTGEWEHIQCEQFKSAKNGSIVLVREGNTPIALVELVSENFQDEALSQRFHHSNFRKVKILSWADKNRYPRAGLFSQGTFKRCVNVEKEQYLFINSWFNQIIKDNNMITLIHLLSNNFNMILTGAPGTGKTYLAKLIAAQMILGKEYNEETASNEEKQKMNEQFDFVQFHPSFDYTDFVEGLRPKEDSNGNVSFRREDGIFMRFCRKALTAYHKAEEKNEEAPKYVFVIDEINRGELSKIFGELFFCIDPGYRGEKGKVKTQYYNLWKNDKDEELRNYGGAEFFFIPKNVYIIGTMNDIDRSVESMDFAFRRRFAFKEIKASENLGMLDEMEDKDNIIKRMENLNVAIEKVEGLSSAYHIGGSYFMKLKLYQNEDKSYDYDSLWNNHLEGLLMEYLRGMADAEKKVKELKEYYDLKQIASRDVDNE